MNDAATVHDAYRYCRELVRRCDTDQYLAGLFAPTAQRKFLYALYAFAFEVGQVKSRVSAPMTGAIRLQWWHDAVMGLRAEEAAANPIMVALFDAAQETATPLELIAAVIEAREAELAGEPGTEAVAATLIAAARFLGAQEDQVRGAASAAAEAMMCAAGDPQKAREAYAAFRANLDLLPKQALPAFLTVSLVPLRLKHPNAPQWRRQVALLRAAWFGFPAV